MSLAIHQNEITLCDVLDRLLDQGVVAAGEVTLSLAGVDLVYVNLQLLLASAATVLESRHRHGIRQRIDEAGSRTGADAP